LNLQVLEKLKWWKDREKGPVQHRHGRAGEHAAKKHLQEQGLKFLTANFNSGRGELDLIFRDADCLVFVEVKARTTGSWTRPAAAVNARKRLALTRCAFDYLRLLKDPHIKIRFDVVEVLLEDGEVAEVRHLPNMFTLTPPFRHG
jgi:putative endonuclease